MPYSELPKLIPSSEDSEILAEPPVWKVIPEHSLLQDFRALLDSIMNRTLSKYTQV